MSFQVPVEIVILAESFKKVTNDSITLVSGLTLPPLTQAKDIWICTERGQELTENEAREIFEYCLQSNLFKYLG